MAIQAPLFTIAIEMRISKETPEINLNDITFTPWAARQVT